MAASAKQKKIDELITKARESLLRNAWFESERLGLKAIAMARQEHDFDRMASIVPVLQEARRKRFEAALESGIVAVVAVPVTEDIKIKRGCYLVKPPQVGSDARRLRLAALNAEVPVAVLCREPMTRNGMLPIVAISPGSTLRVRIDPPEDPEAPDPAWFVEALEILGDSAIETLDPTLPVVRRIDVLLEALDAHPEHDNLHYALEVACKQAHEEAQAQSRTAAAKAASKTKIKS